MSPKTATAVSLSSTGIRRRGRKPLSPTIAEIFDTSAQVSLYPRPQEQVQPQYVAIRELSAYRNLFNKWPDCQREGVWVDRKKKALIDTIFGGDPIGSFAGFKYKDDEDGKMRWGLINGHQRYDAILEYIDGVYRTFTLNEKQSAEPNSRPPYMPGMFFHELPLDVQELFLDYHVTIDKIRKGTAEDIVTQYLRYQNQDPASAAEQLYAYNSKAKHLAKTLAEHKFWEDYYDGRTNRKQKFQSSLFLVALLTLPGIGLDLQVGPYIKGLAAGKFDHKIPEDMYSQIEMVFEKISCLFAGIQFSERGIVIAMCQLIQFLDQAGYQIDWEADRGKLYDWMHAILLASKRSNNPDNRNREIQQLTHAKGQREFWRRHLPRVMRLFNIPEHKWPSIPEEKGKEYKDKSWIVKV